MSKSLRSVAESASTTGRRGTYRLDPEEEALLDQFTNWLEIHDAKTRGTAQSYRSHCAKVSALEIPEDEMTSDQKSAAGALGRFFEWLGE